MKFRLDPEVILFIEMLMVATLILGGTLFWLDYKAVLNEKYDDWALGQIQSCCPCTNIAGNNSFFNFNLSSLESFEVLNEVVEE